MWDAQVAGQAAGRTQYYASDPDVVATQMIGTVPDASLRLGKEVATVVAFLLSDDASYITGVHVEVSGGSV
jgi:NAD(P)-dependent dehydrogenase (short-subunit alcohol dehydrogenase family)